MALSAFDLLGSVLTTLYSAYAGRFDRLGVNEMPEHWAWGFAPGAPAPSGAGRCASSPRIHPNARSGRVVVDALAGWVLVREHSPGTAAAEEVEDDLEDLAGAMQPLGRPVDSATGR